MLPVAILAGGLATRLRPLTETIPKSLVEVAGEPFAFHQLRLLKRRGVQRAVFCAGFLGEMLADAVGDGSRFGLEVGYSFEGERLLGTGGAIAKALPVLGPRFMMLYGDSWLDCDYGAVAAAFVASGKPGLLTVYRNEGRWDTSNTVFEGGRILKFSKTDRSPTMRHIDYGLSAFEAQVFADLPLDAPTDLGTVFTRLVERDSLAAYEMTERFWEVGSFGGLADFEAHISGKA